MDSRAYLGKTVISAPIGASHIANVLFDAVISPNFLFRE